MAVVKHRSPKQTQNNVPYEVLTIVDDTAGMNIVIWNPVEQTDENVIVIVQAQIQCFGNNENEQRYSIKYGVPIHPTLIHEHFSNEVHILASKKLYEINSFNAEEHIECSLIKLLQKENYFNNNNEMEIGNYAKLKIPVTIHEILNAFDITYEKNNEKKLRLDVLCHGIEGRGTTQFSIFGEQNIAIVLDQDDINVESWMKLTSEIQNTIIEDVTKQNFYLYISNYYKDKRFHTFIVGVEPILDS